METFTDREILIMQQELDNNLANYKELVANKLTPDPDNERWFKDRIKDLEAVQTKLENYKAVPVVFAHPRDRKAEVLYACVGIIVVLLLIYYFLFLENTKG